MSLVAESESWSLSGEKLPVVSHAIGAAQRDGLLIAVGSNGLCHALSIPKNTWKSYLVAALWKQTVWTRLPKMKEERYGCGVVSLDKKFYALGGYCGDFFGYRLASMERLESTQGEWTSMPHMTEKREGCGVAVLEKKNLIFAIGGKDALFSRLSSAEMFHTESNQWQRLPNMTTKRAGCAAVAIDGRVFVFGGYDGSKQLRSAECFNLATGRWTNLPPMFWGREYPAAVAVENFIVVIGGKNENGEHLRNVEVFDTKRMLWQRNHNIPDLCERRYQHGAAFMNGIIHVFGDGDSMEVLAVKATSSPQPSPEDVKPDCIKVRVALPPGPLGITFKGTPPVVTKVEKGGAMMGGDLKVGARIVGIILPNGHRKENIATTNLETFLRRQTNSRRILLVEKKIETRVDLDAEIARLEKLLGESVGIFDEETLRDAEEAQQTLPRLQTLVPSMPTAQALRREISNLELEMVKLQTQRKFSQTRPLVEQRKKLRAQLEKEETAGGDAGKKPRAVPLARPNPPSPAPTRERSPSAPPSQLICPISQELMDDPVVAADGFTYDRRSIEQWFAQTRRGRVLSPCTGAALEHCTLVPNHAMRSQIREYQDNNNSRKK